MRQELSREALMALPLDEMLSMSGAIRDEAWGRSLTYSRKVFIPLTQLCRDVCHYCTFADTPHNLPKPYLSVDDALAIARAGAAAGCKEALFTLGDKPEARYSAARSALAEMGFDTTIAYLEHVARRVLEETGLIPHLNPGLLTVDDYARLRPVAGSMGLMLETASDRLSERGMPHYGSPDKVPARRLESIALAGEAKVPFTSGLLIGIGETREERIDALVALRDLHRRHRHLQEIIIQNFCPKPGTRMAAAPEADEYEMLWTIAAARLLLPADVSIQSPPNLNAGRLEQLIEAGINDWGGISPVTIDHVNPEAAWPDIDRLADQCGAAGFELVERLTVYPAFMGRLDEWTNAKLRAPVRALADATGFARDYAWSPGQDCPPPVQPSNLPASSPAGRIERSAPLDRILTRAMAGEELDHGQIVALFETRGAAARDVAAAANELRAKVNGDDVTYVVNRNINYTNICTYSCSFCAFSKTSVKQGLRDKPYLLDMEEIARRVLEARSKGATEVCLQGGIHPSYTGQTYLDIVSAVKSACPDMHVHAFSPLEVSHGASTLELPVETYLGMLRDAGLGSLPGTAAEILHDDVRAILCPDKLSTDEWLAVVGAAHGVGLPTTSTIMFGHVDTPAHWAAHILALRRQQKATGGFTEFVPLPFVHMASPVYMKGMARRGPTWRETVLMHAVGRLALHGAIGNIQTSWVKLGLDGAMACLNAGANDVGGTLMNESISRAAGAAHGQEMDPQTIESAMRAVGRPPRQRSTLYAIPPGSTPAYGLQAQPLS